MAEVTDSAVLETLEEQGFAVLPDVIDGPLTDRANTALLRAAARSEQQGMPTRLEILDPGGCNVRVYDLLEHDPVFAELVAHPQVIPYVDELLDHDLMISNFTANTALPGSRSMNAHCDQSTVMPEPWTQRYTMNAIWCLDDVDEENGATRYLPRSHLITGWNDVPADPTSGMRSFSASAGSVILMDGRLWHTSGANRSNDRRRALLFAFYSRSFLRLQNNWFQSLSSATQASLTPQVRHWLGLSGGNMKYGTYLTSPDRV